MRCTVYCLSSVNMIDSQMRLSLPCYEGFMKFLIWPEPESVSKTKYSSDHSKIIFLLPNIWDKFGETKCSFYFQSISCYGLLSQHPISNPQPTGRSIILPFFHGSRYAAIPATSTDGIIQVDICLRRPESLVYHDCCLHLADLKVYLSYFLSYYTCKYCLGSPIYAELQS